MSKEFELRQRIVQEALRRISTEGLAFVMDQLLDIGEQSRLHGSVLAEALGILKDQHKNPGDYNSGVAVGWFLIRQSAGVEDCCKLTREDAVAYAARVKREMDTFARETGGIESHYD